MSAVAVILGVAAWAAAPAFAQDSKDDLRKEVDQLKKEVEALKQEKEAKPAPASSPVKDAALMKLGEDSTILDKLIDQTAISGFVDVGFVFNLDRTENHENGNIPGNNVAPGSVRAFDRNDRSFYLHNAQLNISRTATKDLITGYNVEISMGSDANVIAAAPSSAFPDDDYFDIQEANIQILAPVGNGIDIRVGKFATLAGFEVIESKDNYNYSRSLPFYMAIPFTHTGVRAAYQVIPQVKVTAGVNNGWDMVEDTNDAKTFEGQIAITPVEWLTFYATLYAGCEIPGAAGHDPGLDRTLVDLILVATNIPGVKGLSLAVNVDIGEEEETSAVTALDDAEWLGVAVYGKYQINDSWAVAVRYSMLDDKEGHRVGLVAGEEVTLDEVTITLEYRISKDTVARLEFRQDSASEDVFLDHQTPEDSQATIGAEFIITF
jgi:hypothetical protein